MRDMAYLGANLLSIIMPKYKYNSFPLRGGSAVGGGEV